MTLLEALISMLLFSIALLGLDAMEVWSLHQHLNIYYESVAHNQIENMKERLKALKDKNGIEGQIALWNKENQAVLPQGRGKVSVSYPHYAIDITWGEGEKGYQNDHRGDKAGWLHEDVIL